MTIPPVAGAKLDEVYVRGGDETPASAWSELFALRDGRVALSLGDVARAGLPGAFMMGQLRRTVRLAALLDPEPSVVLHVAHQQLLANADVEISATAFFGVFDPSDSTLTYASAAHPYAACYLPNGAAAALAAKGGALGDRNAGFRPSRTLTLVPGALVVVYSEALADNGPAFDRAARGAHAASVANHAHRIADAVFWDRKPGRDVAVITLAIDRR
jgi:serine phosphatase RsbU (regulator of sigma subunit)